MHDFTKFQLLKPRLLEGVDKMLAEDIARLMAMIPQEEALASRDNGNAIRGMRIFVLYRVHVWSKIFLLFRNFGLIWGSRFSISWVPHSSFHDADMRDFLG